ncbi:unnamed protein product [Penicillium salamii]|uniref:Fungal lipase-type domain-containing protein n=1 Tax=Penicillium salamii TaxID=1612424 RepID=A0A9W4JW52_9EURO|nr:unnamed protein product [Penicillium salamii]CAG8308342.1 unnamed protein product [Penicillium salamii]CAG8417884.1 unnamed protein product [Penicillium salamii]
MFLSTVGLWACLLSLATSAFASHGHGHGHSHASHISRREISSELFDKFKLFAQLATITNCDQNINRTGYPLTCDQGPCDLVQADDTEIVNTYHHKTGGTGYIALDHTRKLIIVTFRGTITFPDLYQDFRIPILTPVPEICDGCGAHPGFWDYWLSAKDQIIEELRAYTKQNPDYRVSVTGYSLGAGVATVAGVALRVEGIPCDIWTFGAAKPGNMKLAEFITNQQKPVSIYRATHAKDLITALPFNTIGFDYTQPSPEFWIDQPSGEVVTPDVVKYIEGINNQTGNLGQHHRSIGEEHEWYFGNMTVCAPSADLYALF